MPSVVFSDTYYVTNVGTSSQNVRVNYSETYSDSANASTIRITSIEIAADRQLGGCVIRGDLYINGTLMVSMPTGTSSYTATIPGGLNSYATVANASGGSVSVAHNAEGAATMTVELRNGEQSVFGAAFSGHMFGIRTPASQSVSLTTHRPTYTVAYNANGGSGAPSSQTKTYGTSLTLSSTKPTRSSRSASPAKYTVTFNANSGTVSPTSKDAARTISYTFSKWNTKSDGSGTSYSPGGSYSTNAAATLYAQWSSSTSTASITLPTPTRGGYSFNGWYTAATGGTKVGAGGASYTPSSNITIYAQWTGLASTIASKTSSVATQGTFTLSVSRKSSAYYHKVTFKIGSTTLSTSSAFATTLNYTVPRTWFNNYGSQTSLTVTASVQTYTTSACTTAVGSPATTSFTVTADSGMKPSVASGWVTAAAYNTGAVSGMTGYIKGYSRATITFNASKITNAAGASVSSYSITCQGSTDSTSPYQTPVLTSASVPVTCKVTDTRGRSASGTLTLTVLDYANPSLSKISVFRCTANGTASEDGTYYSVKATSTFSSINGQNTCTLKVSHAASGGSYGTEYTLTSGTARVIGSLSVDKSYTVRIKATDSLGNSATYTAIVPTRLWAMKFRPDGNGVAFGKAAELDSTFDVSSEWDVKFGKPLAVPSGGTGATTVSGAPFARKVYPANDVYVSADYSQDMPITIWQNNADSSQRYGLVVSKTYIGLYDTNNGSWVWRTPLMTQSLGAWQIEQGGTGGTTAAAARLNLEVPSIHEVTTAQSYRINGVNFIFRRYGKIVVCATDGSVTNAVTSNASMGSTTVADSYKPITSEIRYIPVTPAATIQFNLSTNGTFQVGYAYPEIAAGVALRGTFVYVAAG